MDRRDWLTVAQLARLTQISARSIWRYLRKSGMKRYRRKMPGGRRWLWHRHVIPSLRDEHQRGLARTGRLFGPALAARSRGKGKR